MIEVVVLEVTNEELKIKAVNMGNEQKIVVLEVVRSGLRRKGKEKCRHRNE